MTTTPILLTLTGLGLVLAILFLLLRRRGAEGGDEAGDEPRRVRILVRGGYEPEYVELERGTPAVLEFVREEDDPCSERVILDGFNRSVYLPAFATTEVELSPERTGEFEFACGLGRLKGRIVVKEARGAK